MSLNLSLLASVAHAADVAPAAAAGGSSALMTFMPLILIFAVMYFLMIRPQQKKQKEHSAMLNAIQKGDKIQTNGGLIGNVTGLDQNEITLEIAPQVRVKVARGFVSRVVRTPDNSPPPAAKGKVSIEKKLTGGKL